MSKIYKLSIEVLASVGIIVGFIGIVLLVYRLFA